MPKKLRDDSLTPTLVNSIKRGLHFLKKTQEKNGSFISYSSPDPLHFSQKHPYHTTFFSSVILRSLNEIKQTHPHLTLLRTQLCAFLLDQKSPHWSWNYWDRHSPQAQTLPYPDDLDDTFMALTALAGFESTLISGEVLGYIAQHLTFCEVKEGGPYKTWLIEPQADQVWHDVDLAVNSTVADFLALQEISLPHLETLVESAIQKRNYKSAYYPSPYPLLYSLARWYQGKSRQLLSQFLLDHQNSAGHWGTPLDTALAVSSLLLLKYPADKLHPALKHLLKTERQGHWPASAFCLDPAQKGTLYYAGSPSLTTAVVIEALARFDRAMEIERQAKFHSLSSSALDGQGQHIYRSVVRQTQSFFKTLPMPLRPSALRFLEKMLKADIDQQIVLLPFFFTLSLGKKGQKVPESLLVQLGVANLLGWIAYTILDDFLDEEGQTDKLSVATVCLRELTRIFVHILPAKTGFEMIFQQVMNQLDGANAWELAHCRAVKQDQRLRLPVPLPEYGAFKQLAQKSLGHVLGPVAILLYLGYKPDSIEVKKFWQFAQHYLIARQLDDDAHDWEEDLQRGHLNAVGTATLKAWLKRKKSGGTTVTLTTSTQNGLRSLFWHTIVTEISHTIQRHTQRSRKALLANPVITHPQFFERILQKIEDSATKALTDRDQTLQFMKTFR